MRRVLTWTLRGITLFVALLIVLTATVAVILNTHSGTRWALERVDAALGGELLIADFSGTLWQGLQLPSIRYRDQNRDIDASALSLNIDWGALLAGQAALHHVHATSLRIQRRSEPSPEPAPFSISMAPLPFPVAVARGSFDEIVIPGGSEPRRFTNVTLRGASINGSTIRAAAVTAVTDGIDLGVEKLRLVLAGDAPAAARINWSIAISGWSGQGSLRGSLALLTFEQTIAGPFPFTAAGTVQLLQQTEPVFAADLSWDGWSIAGYQLREGGAQFRGTTTRYEVDYQALLQMPDALQLRIAGRGTGNLRQLDSFAAQIASGLGAAEVAGTLTWLPAFGTAVAVHATQIDPAYFAPSLHGALDADAQLSIDDMGTAELTNVAVRGMLNGVPVAANGELSLAPQQLRCVECALSVGSNQLRIDGLASARELDLSFFIDAPDAQQLWPDIGGSARGSGRLLGSWQRPQFTGALSAQRFSYAAWTADSIAIDSQDSSLESLAVRADITALRNGDTDIGTFNVRGSGPPADVVLDVAWVFRDLQITVAGNLQPDGPGLGGGIRQAAVHDPQTGDWRLQAPFQFRFADSSLSIDPHLWSGDSGRLQLTRFVMTRDETQLVASIEKFPLRIADLVLPPAIHLLGEASADIDVRRSGATWSGTFDWLQQDTVMRAIESDTQSTDVRIPRAALHADFHDGGVTARASVVIEPGVSGDLDLQLSALDPSAWMQAELRLHGEDWSWIPAVVPEIDSFAGSIAASVQANGPLLTPELSGSVEWRDGHVLLPALNIPLSKISIIIAGAPQGTATIQGTAKAGDGTLAISGNIDRLMQPTRSMTLQVTGKSAALIDWPEYRVWGSPDMTVVGDASGWQFSGKLLVPRADFEIREIPVGATVVSPDVVIIGAEEVSIAPTRVSGEARLSLGDQVRVKAMGLDTGLAGELLVRVLPNREMSAEGRISLVNGSFAAQGQNLRIQNGTLTFTGPLDNPIVDVRAVRVIDTFDGAVTAGIHLHGRAQDLTSTVFSEPPMNDVDALSYLVIGRPLNQATEAEGGQLSGAAVSLGLRQATRLTEQIGQSIGLDQLSLSGDGGDSTTLIAGKKINTRLYARYAYGIFSRLGTLLLRYRLTERLTLEAGAGESQSIDILYTVEQH